MDDNMKFCPNHGQVDRPTGSFERVIRDMWDRDKCPLWVGGPKRVLCKQPLSASREVAETMFPSDIEAANEQMRQAQSAMAEDGNTLDPRLADILTDAIEDNRQLGDELADALAQPVKYCPEHGEFERPLFTIPRTRWDADLCPWVVDDQPLTHCPERLRVKDDLGDYSIHYYCQICERRVGFEEVEPWADGLRHIGGDNRYAPANQTARCTGRVRMIEIEI